MKLSQLFLALLVTLLGARAQENVTIKFQYSMLAPKPLPVLPAASTQDLSERYEKLRKEYNTMVDNMHNILQTQTENTKTTVKLDVREKYLAQKVKLSLGKLWHNMRKLRLQNYTKHEQTAKIMRSVVEHGNDLFLVYKNATTTCQDGELEFLPNGEQREEYSSIARQLVNINQKAEVTFHNFEEDLFHLQWECERSASMIIIGKTYSAVLLERESLLTGFMYVCFMIFGGFAAVAILMFICIVVAAHRSNAPARSNV